LLEDSLVDLGGIRGGFGRDLVRKFDLHKGCKSWRSTMHASESINAIWSGMRLFFIQKGIPLV
jgi:hypothetical protein